MACSCLKKLQLYPHEIPSQELICGTSAEFFPCLNFLSLPIRAASSLKSLPPPFFPSFKKLSGGVSKAYSKRKQPVPTYGEASQRFPHNILGDQPRRHAEVFISQKACVCPECSEHLEPRHLGQIPSFLAAWEAVLCLIDRAIAFPQGSPHIKTLCPSPPAQS